MEIGFTWFGKPRQGRAEDEPHMFIQSTWICLFKPRGLLSPDAGGPGPDPPASSSGHTALMFSLLLKSMTTSAVWESRLTVNAQQQDSSKSENNSPWIYLGRSHPWWLAHCSKVLSRLFLWLVTSFILAYGAWRHDTEWTFYTWIKVDIWQFLSGSSEERISGTRFIAYFKWDTSVSLLALFLPLKKFKEVS